MPDRNFLSLACPTCGSGSVSLTVTTTARLYPDGSDAYGDKVIVEDGRAWCHAGCGWEGVARDLVEVVHDEEDEEG